MKKGNAFSYNRTYQVDASSIMHPEFFIVVNKYGEITFGSKFYEPSKREAEAFRDEFGGRVISGFSGEAKKLLGEL